MKSLQSLVRLILLAVVSSATAAGAPDPVDATVPDALRPWVPWVLDGQDRRDCPVGSLAPEAATSESLNREPSKDGRSCAWPGRLFLDLDAKGGIFVQSWTIYAPSWVPLPGDADTWPLDVSAGESPLPAVLREGAPAVELPAGSHLISGRFQWQAAPNGLSLPPETGLVSLSLYGVPVDSPRLERGGRLWIANPADTGAGEEGDGLDIRVFRRIDDDLPMRVISRLELDVSGRARQVRLGPVLLAGGVPLRVQSPLPVRLDQDDWLLVQMRPGRWVVQIDSYRAGAVTALKRPVTEPPWPRQELWSFAAHPDLRQVSVSGLVQVDPRQVAVPADWSRLPSYRVDQGDEMRLEVRRRGNPDPGPDRLRLSRELWLDFDGGGYSVQDRVDGELTRSWRLDAAPPLVLGQVRVDGEPRLITARGEDGTAGVEVRRGRLSLVADGRLEQPPDVAPVSSWELDLESVQTQLHLPPGWDLLAVSGADNLPDSWVSRWSLLDLFLVLILVTGVHRLWGWRWGLVALAALALTWNQPDAPRLLWLQVLAATALVRVLPSGEAGVMPRIRSAVRWYFRLAVLALVVMSLPFLVSQVRQGLYPQLERPWVAIGGGDTSRIAAGEAASSGIEKQASVARLSAPAKPVGSSLDADGEMVQAPVSPAPPPRSVSVGVDESNALVQSGSGVPDWQWTRFDLRWGGPVAVGEQVDLWLLSPRWGAIMSLLGAALVVLLGWRLSGIGATRKPDKRGPGPHEPAQARTVTRADTQVTDVGGRFAVFVLLVAATLGSWTGGVVRAGELPSPELLAELRSRLLKPPDCAPACVSLPMLVLHADPRTLHLTLTLDAVVDAVAPIPGGPGGWWPRTLLLDQQPLENVRRGADDELQVVVPAGRHRLELVGPLAAASQVEIPFPLRPMQIRAELEGWTLEGVDAAGRPGPQVRLLRIAGHGEALRELTQGALPPLLAVDRLLRLGPQWRVETRLRRLSPAEFPLVLPVPLLPGESVLTPETQVRNAEVLASLAPGETEASWVSSLEQSPTLGLEGAADPRIAESWTLDLGPMWHLDWEGIAPVQRQSGDAEWSPSWRPLPGEGLVLRLSRPAAIPGPTLTLDRVQYNLEPGARARDATLEISVRSTQGGTHVLGLPAGAIPIAFTADGTELPLPPQGGRLELPLIPGTQWVSLRWRELGGIGLRLVPEPVDLGSPAVNLGLSVRMPQDRWVLFVGGPRVGPVVLFWGVLLVFAGLAVGLARAAPTPLRLIDWLLLGVGLALAEPLVAVLVVGWLLALGLRRGMDEQVPRWRYNLIQVTLVLLTLVALGGLFDSVSQGLLGRPEMQITGSGSHANLLRWYQDRGGPELPEISVVSLPMWVYRALMLAWALWLALRLLDWLRWGWAGFSHPMLWRETKIGLGLGGLGRRPGKGGG